MVSRGEEVRRVVNMSKHCTRQAPIPLEHAKSLCFHPNPANKTTTKTTTQVTREG